MLQESCTCYIGNLSFYTTETQLWAAFSRFGPVERIVMGLDRHRRTPCGFAFVIYAQKEGADLAVSWLNGTTLDERPIRVDKDHGFREGRQFGRGRSGGQVRDEHRLDYDSGRGGFGRRSDAPGPQGGGGGGGGGGRGARPVRPGGAVRGGARVPPRSLRLGPEARVVPAVVDPGDGRRRRGPRRPALAVAGRPRGPPHRRLVVRLPPRLPAAVRRGHGAGGSAPRGVRRRGRGAWAAGA